MIEFGRSSVLYLWLYFFGTSFGMAEQPTGQRILARVVNLAGQASELDWINSRTGILGESFGMASRSIQALIDDGSMVVIRTEPIDHG
jgi:hypothetical protein